jgi:hypothetical protein
LLTAVAAMAASSVASVGCATTDEVDAGDGVGSGGGGAGAPEETPGGEELGGGVETPELCPSATGVYAADPAESNILFLVDRSGSMHLSVSDTDTRWTATKAGLFGLLDSMPSDINAGVVMFPSGDAPIDCCVITADNVITCGGCAPGELPGTEQRCDPGAYMDPPVEVAPMTPAQVDAIKSYVSTADDEFYWGTPLAPALEGAVDAQVAASANGISSIVLVTDGNPTSCDTASDPYANDLARVTDAAALGLSASSPVRTYVLGVIDGDQGANAANLSQVALAGGTARYAGCEEVDDCAYSVNVQNFEADMRDALNAIALEAFDCTFDLPEVEMGTPDLAAVNITVSSPAGSTVVPKDSSHANGWDYLPGDTQVQLYGPACEALKADATASVEVVVGCETVGE